MPQITLDVADSVYDHAQRLALGTGQQVADILSDTLERFLAGPPSIPYSSDQEILKLTELQLEPSQDLRLSALLAQQNAGMLTSEEKQELAALMHIYEQGLLLKAQALQEAVQRGLLESERPK